MNKKLFSTSAIAIVIIGGLVGFYLWRDLSARPNYSQVAVKKGSISEVLSLDGKVRSQNDSDLGFEITGKIIELNHEVGDQVSEGEILAKINSADLADQYNQAKNSAESAQQLLDEYKNLKKKEQYKLSSMKKNDSEYNSSDKSGQKEQIQAQQNLIDSQESAVKAAWDNVEAKKDQLDKAVLRAPFSGVITKQNVELGEIASATVPVLTLTDENNFEVEAYVSQMDVDKVDANDAAKIVFAENENQEYSAKVISVDPAGTDINGVSNYKIKLQFVDSIPDLRAGMDVSINLDASQKNNVLLIPQNAVFEDGGKKFVYVLKGGLRSSKEIKAGIHGSDGMIEVLSGLSEGEQILAIKN